MRRLGDPKRSLERALLRAFLVYDPETGTFARRDGKPLSIGYPQGYVRLRFPDGEFVAHRLAFLYMLGVIPEQVDHINGDKADNRWKNLRAADNSSNVANTPRRSTNRSGYRGVYQSDTGRWRAEITCRGVKHRLGTFESPDLAHAAYQAAAKEMFGEFTRGDAGDGRSNHSTAPAWDVPSAAA